MKIILLISALTITIYSFSQQEQITTQFWNNYSFYNPASVGISYKHQVAVHYRNQWDKVNGAPNSISGNYNYSLNRNHGIGINYSFETIGLSKQHSGAMNYSYRIHFNDTEKHFLSIGVGLGIKNHTLDYSKLIYPTDTFDVISTKVNNTYPTLSFGLVYQIKEFNVGISSTQITESFLASDRSYNPARHYYFMSSYNIVFGEKFSLKPQILIGTELTKISGNFNLLATAFKNYSLGVSYRTADAVSFISQVDIIRKFRIGYSYDLNISNLEGTSKGSHEIVLGFLLK